MFGPPEDDYDCCPDCTSFQQCPRCKALNPPREDCEHSECEPDSVGVFWHRCKKRGVGKRCPECPGSGLERLGKFGEIQ